MRISISLAVGSPTARVAAIMVATLLLALMVAGAGIAGTRLLAADAAIVVAQDGSGTVPPSPRRSPWPRTATPSSSGPGRTSRPSSSKRTSPCRRRAGRGDHRRGSRGWADCPDRGRPRLPATAYAVLLQDTDATVSGITLRGERSRVHASGGSPTLERLALESVDIRTRLHSATSAACLSPAVLAAPGEFVVD